MKMEWDTSMVGLKNNHMQKSRPKWWTPEIQLGTQKLDQMQNNHGNFKCSCEEGNLVTTPCQASLRRMYCSVAVTFLSQDGIVAFGNAPQVLCPVSQKLSEDCPQNRTSVGCNTDHSQPQWEESSASSLFFNSHLCFRWSTLWTPCLSLHWVSQAPHHLGAVCPLSTK